MPNPIDPKKFTNNLFAVLEETFENHHGVYLDKGTSLFETLATITAEEASRPVSAHCASLAAQVSHVVFYMEVLEKAIKDVEVGKVDWDDIWSRVEVVTAEEWAITNHQLKDTYQRISALLYGVENWDDDRIGGAMAIVIHTAYHLGEIRQALCTLR
ncbi:MAG: hypothetical protein LCI00_18840 [Chloroflexi bacterium]|nr:hypothetical protein [Chloroflexota bacterium]MCC6894571.1 hypothetical protein [Anaerolineae bacterium]